MSDQQVPFQLGRDEQMITSGPTRYLRSTPTNLGYNPVDGTLWITSQRIVFVPAPNYGMRRTYRMVGAMNPAQFPLKRVVNYETLEKRIQWQNKQVLKLIFDNGGREYFTLEDPSGWGMTVLSNREKAPEMAYTDVPHVTSGVEANQSKTFVIVLGGAVRQRCAVLRHRRGGRNAGGQIALSVGGAACAEGICPALAQAKVSVLQELAAARKRRPILDGVQGRRLAGQVLLRVDGKQPGMQILCGAPFEFLDGIYACFFKKVRVDPGNPFDPRQVGVVGQLQDDLLGHACKSCQLFASLGRDDRVEQLFRSFQMF
jgi:hypothetical protein